MTTGIEVVIGVPLQVGVVFGFVEYIRMNNSSVYSFSISSLSFITLIYTSAFTTLF